MGCETKRKGEVSEVVVMAELMKRGFTVLQPFGDNQPYDMVIDQGGMFYRIQCKTGKLVKGVVQFRTVSTLPRLNGTYDYKSYEGKIEFFAIYCPDNESTYIVPIEEIGKGIGYLRLEKPKNNQKKGIRLAEDYHIDKFDIKARRPVS